MIWKKVLAKLGERGIIDARNCISWKNYNLFIIHLYAFVYVEIHQEWKSRFHQDEMSRPDGSMQCRACPRR